jgi:hypothetical protein
VSLADLLAQPGFFGALWEKDQFGVKACWELTRRCAWSRSMAQ